MVFHGARLIVAEFAVGVFLPLGLGLLALLRGRALWQSALGCYLLCLSLNYVPLLIHSLLISNRGNARREVDAELAGNKRDLVKYQRQSLLLLVPLAVFLLAITQRRRGEDNSAGSR
jgi:membrane protein implicated in regulation of membrane protease activity